MTQPCHYLALRLLLTTSRQKIELSQSDIVQQYLASMQASSENRGEDDEDFS